VVCLVSFLLLLSERESQFLYLSCFDWHRRRGEWAEPGCGFREGDDVAQGLFIGHHHHQSVKAEGKAAVRGCPVFESM